MKIIMLAIVWLVLAASLVVSSDAQNGDTEAFGRLKSLAGDWTANTPKGKIQIHYEVVSGGSAVLERFESAELGADNVMVTVYYMNGGHLQLTHYCMAHNQPHMQAESFDPAIRELRFAFLNATGLATPEAGHMHNANFRFIDANHFATDWQFYEGGKPKFDESVQYTRVQ